ncbi:MAG: putative ubiquitin family protein, partial [Streblomastix strix]
MKIIAFDELRLVFAGKQLENGCTLQDYNIVKDATLQLLLRLCGGMQIFIKTNTAKIIELEVNSKDTILNIKQHIRSLQGISTDNQQLLLSGSHLENFQTLQNCGVQSGATLDLFLKIESGSINTTSFESHLSVSNLISRYNQSAKTKETTQPNPIEQYGRQIMICKDGHVDRQSKAVYDGNIILNKDNSVSITSPWVKLGVVRVKDDGNLEKDQAIMQYVIDRSKELTTEDIRTPNDQRKFRNEEKNKAKQEDNTKEYDNKKLDADHQASLQMVVELLKHKPGRRYNIETIKEECRQIPLEMVPRNLNRGKFNTLDQSIINKIESGEQFTPEEFTHIQRIQGGFGKALQSGE